MTCAAQRPRMPKVEKGQRLGRVTLTGGGGVMKDKSCPSAISHSLSLCSLAEVQLPQPI